jgi:hypothetical protein
MSNDAIKAKHPVSTPALQPGPSKEERLEARRVISNIARDAAIAIRALSQMVGTTQDMNESGEPDLAAAGGGIHGPSVGPHLEAMRDAMASVAQQVNALGGLVQSLGNYGF